MRADSRLRNMALIAAVFVAFPLFLAWKDHGPDFIAQYWNIFRAFALPLMVLFGMTAWRVWKMATLLDGGTRFKGVVESCRWGRHSHTADIRFSTTLGPRTVTVHVPSGMPTLIGAGDEVTILVDTPDRPRMAVLVASGPIEGRSPGQV